MSITAQTRMMMLCHTSLVQNKKFNYQYMI